MILTLLSLFCLFPFPRSSNLPSRGTRLLNRSRIQGVLTNSPDSPRCGGGVEQQIPRPRRSSSLTKTPSPFQAHANTPPTTINRGINSVATTTDDLSITRSTRNTMIQDVLYFKKQLLRLRRLLQEVRKGDEGETRAVLLIFNFCSSCFSFLFMFLRSSVAFVCN